MNQDQKHKIERIAELEDKIAALNAEIKQLKKGSASTIAKFKPSEGENGPNERKERSRTRVALHESEDRLLLAKEAGKIGIHDYRPVSGTLHWDERLRELWGLGPDDPVNYEVFLSGIHPEDREATDAAVQRALDPSGDGRLETEYRLVRDGRTLWISATGRTTFEDGRAVRFVGTVQDITDRKKAEEALQKERNKLQLYMDTTNTVIVALDVSGNVTMLNRYGLELFGYKEEEIIGRNWFEVALPDPDEIERVYPIFQRIMQGDLDLGRYFENEVLTASGARVLIAWRNNYLRDENGRIIGTLSSGIDVTERKQAEEALRQQAQLLHLSYDAILVWRKDGGIEHWNRGAEQLYGFTESEVLGRTTHRLLKTIHPVPWLEIEAAMREHGQWEGELRHYAKDGHEVTVSARHQLVLGTDGIERILETNRDITDSKQAEEKLRKSEVNMARAQKIIHLGNWEWDLKTNAFTCSDEHYRMYGLEPGDFPIDTFINLVHEDDRQYIKESLAAALNKGKPYDVECRVVRPDGSTRFLHQEGEAVYDEKGELTGMFGIALDITELRKKDEELRQLNRTYHALGKANQAMMRAEDESRLLEAVCRIIVEDCGHPMVWIGFAEDDEAKTVRPAAQAGFEEGYLEATKITWSDTELGRGPTGTAIRTGAPDVCLDFLTESRMRPWRENAIQRGYASSIALPLKAGGQTFGALTIYSKKQGDFTEAEVKLLSELAEDLAYGITVLRLRIAHQESEMKLRQLNKTLEQKVADRTRLAEDRARQLRALVSELTIAEQRERHRLRGILHDHLQQFLVAAKMNAEMLSAKVDTPQKQFLQNIKDLIGQSIQESRSLTAELAPTALHQGGLLSALKWLVQWMQEKHGLTVELQAESGIDSQPEDISILMFQCIRELLFNVVKHAGVKTARIDFAREGKDRLRAVVSDRGIGFDPEVAWQKSESGAGFGLFSIRERVTLLGGSLEVESAPGKGTAFSLMVPLEAPAKRDGERIENIVTEIQEAKASTEKIISM